MLYSTKVAPVDFKEFSNWDHGGKHYRNRREAEDEDNSSKIRSLFIKKFDETIKSTYK